MKNFLPLLILLLLAPSAYAQVNSPYTRGISVRQATDPNCTRLGLVYFNTATLKPRVCKVLGTPGTWEDMTAGSGAGTGDVTGPVSSVAGEVVEFSDTTGKAIRRSVGNGFLFVTSGVASFVAGTGTGAVVRATSPTLVTPALGTPSAVVLTNATGLPVGGIAGLGGGVGTFLATPSSATLAAAITGETGTGAAVFGTSPTLVTPNITGPVGIVKGDVGLGNVDNTSDAAKPVSTATQAALDLKADEAAVVKTTGNQTVGGIKTFTSDPVVPDEAYDATAWNGSLEPPTKNAVRDKIESLGGGGGAGDVVGPASSVDGVAAVFDSTTGKLLRQAAGTGFAKLTSGVLSAGSIADADVPNNITVDLATTATTANAGDSATAFFSSGALEKARQFAATVYTDQANTYGAFGQDFGAAPFLSIPNGPGQMPTTSGHIAFDTTSNRYGAGIGGGYYYFVHPDSTDTLANKTLLVPVIADFTNAAHGHTDAAGGGVLTDAAVPNNITVDLATAATTAGAGDSATAFFSTGTVEPARLGSGTPSSGNFLRGDGSWQAVSGTGDVTGPASSVEGEVVEFDSTTGKLLQRSTGNGFLFATSGVASYVTGTGSGAVVRATSPTLVTPALGTPSSATLTNATGLPIDTGVSGLGTGVATLLGTPSSANLAAALTDETGTGAAVLATSPTLVTPALGTPSSATLTNATGLPISTGVSGLAANVATFLGTPSSANLAAALTNETGSGAAVFGTSPTLATPVINVGSDATGDIYYRSAGGAFTRLGAGTNGHFLSLASGLPAWAAVTASAAGSDTQLQRNNAGALGAVTGATSNGTDLTLGSGNLRATRPRFTTSIDDANGNEVIVTPATASAVNEVTVTNAAAGGAPTIAASGGDANINLVLSGKGTGTVLIGGASGAFGLLDTDASHYLDLVPGSNLTADRTLTLTTGDANVLLNLTAGSDGQVMTYDTGTSSWRAESAAGGSGFDPLDLTSVYVREDFVGGTQANGAIGTEGWAFSNMAGSGSATNPAPVHPRHGVLQIETGASSGDAVAIGLFGTSGYGTRFDDLSANTNWDSFWVFALNSTADVKVRVGFCDTIGNGEAVRPGNFVGLAFDTALAHTNFHFETRSGATSTMTDSGVAANTSFHKVRIRSTGATQVKYTLDAGSETTVTTNVPTADLSPCAIIGNNTAAEKNMKVDFFAFRMTGLTR